MQHPGFFDRAGPFSLGELAKAAGAELAGDADPASVIEDVRPLDLAGAADVSFLDNRKYLKALEATKAGACFILPALKGKAPAGTAALLSATPYHAYAKALWLFYPDAGRPKVADSRSDGDSRHLIHPTAQLEEGAIVEPGAIIGREARIGRGTVVAAGAVVGFRVSIGRDGFIGPGSAVTHALIGDRVIIHAGVRIGQDGFGFAMGPGGHFKVPQIGRVIVQDDVEIGANSTIDRGALKDTVIGEGTKIDNLVQIGHNVVVGRHCVIVAQVGIAGSTELGDFVVLGGQVGVIGHTKVGAGAQIAAQSGVTGEVPPGAKLCGAPARPIVTFAREIAALKRLAERKGEN
ncbi:MAG: UDP-3-O-(3-hydroxymyristoyl)glucosamine N-acyltransferase [Hyphomicrobiaceae bacterium]